jgi:hypothetical protein
MSAKAPRAGAVGGSRAGALRERAASTPSTHALTASESAWLAAAPCAVALTLAVYFLGPALGRALFAPPAHNDVWSVFLAGGPARPEPTEHARYVIALLGPLLMGGAVVALRGRRVSVRGSRLLALIGRGAAVAFVITCVVAQRRHVYPGWITGTSPRRTIYFTTATLVAAAGIALLAFALRTRGRSTRMAALMRETAAKRVGAGVAAALFLLAWLLTGSNTEATLATANGATWPNLPFWLDEAFAVLLGHPPLVDFHAQYGQLWAYVAAAGMAMLGTTLAVYATIMLAGAAGAMAAIFAVLRRVVGSSLGALAVFLPFVATSFFMEYGPPANRYSPASLFSLFPMRYAGPYVLLWLVVRRSGRPLGRPVPLFAVAGLVAINNVEFGIPALGATLAALALSAPSRSRRELTRLAASALAGIALAIAAVASLTLLVAGSLPHFGMLSTFPRIYGQQGFGLMPMPTLGFHLVVYLTFASALVLAIVRLADGDDDPHLTAALAWAGIFGLGAGAYFVGRSHPHVLIDLFSAWALALSLLFVAVARGLLRSTRRPTVAEWLVLLGFGVAVCSLAQTPTPWSQLHRLQQRAPGPSLLSLDAKTVRRITRPSEPVALLMMEGHRIAYELGLRNVTPYANVGSMLTRGQWRETIDALRAAHGRTLVISVQDLLQQRVDWLQRAGFRVSFMDSRTLAFTR